MKRRNIELVQRELNYRFPVSPFNYIKKESRLRKMLFGKNDEMRSGIIDSMGLNIRKREYK